MKARRRKIAHDCPNGAKGWSDAEIRMNSCRRCGQPLFLDKIAFAQGPERTSVRIPTNQER